MEKPPLLVIVGPTASGKTEIAFEISKLLPIEMISCDSMQVYKSMPITTQTPPKRVLWALKTHLVSFLSPEKEYNAEMFRKDALLCIHKILKKKKIPLIVGGTGLYLRALLDGLFETGEEGPSKDEALRKKLLVEQEKHGGDYLHKKLEKVDAVSAKKIHLNDHRRLVRALEIYYLTKKPFSTQKDSRKGVREEFACRIFLLDREREDLYDRINRRAEGMLREGLVGEVQGLLRIKLSQTAQMALGIKEIKGFLDGQFSLEQAVELLRKNTRNYAKRQLSWFRHEKGIEVVGVEADEPAFKVASKIVKLWGLAPCIGLGPS